MVCRLAKYFAAITLVLNLASGCSDAEVSTTADECNANEYYNPLSDTCVLLRHAPNLPGDDAGPGDDASSSNNVVNDDVAILDPVDPDPVDPDPVDPDPVDPDPGNPNNNVPCDADGDGYLSIACGGDDCDDTDALVNPGQTEVCSFVDNNCSGQINDDLNCTFYAQTSTRLYRLDPFQGVLSDLMAVPSGVTDVDTHPDGTLYAISPTKLYKLPVGAASWQTVGSMGTIGNANGLCIDTFGKAYITTSDNLLTVDLSTARATLVGSMGHNSSGDCVINKADSLYMSASVFSGTDRLVLLNGNTGQATLIGNIGFDSVYGLTAAWGRLFGLTGNGQLIEINATTGQGRLLHNFAGKTWYGAASTPGR
ncbi:MAG: putative metal-binding motif-containing protein [Bradymonadaceae bacterium]|nr:putative metal-binding motif-containing protein [Lujinxingiaceae bacterium]